MENTLKDISAGSTLNCLVNEKQLRILFIFNKAFQKDIAVFKS